MLRRNLLADRSFSTMKKSSEQMICFAGAEKKSGSASPSEEGMR
jgi:hypothetical protein